MKQGHHCMSNEEANVQCAAPEMFFNCLPRKICSDTAHLRNSPENIVFFFPSKTTGSKLSPKSKGNIMAWLCKQDLTLQPSRTKLVSWKRSPSLSWQPGLPKLVGRTQSCVCLSHTLSHCRKANMIISYKASGPYYSVLCLCPHESAYYGFIAVQWTHEADPYTCCKCWGGRPRWEYSLPLLSF